MSWRKLLAYLAIYVLWGGSFLAIREVVAAVPPFFAAAIRFLAAGALLLIYSWLRGWRGSGRREMLSVTALGLIMFTCMYAGLFWGEIRVPSGLAAVISAFIPLWVFLGELLWLRTQRFTLPALAGLALGLLGVVLLALGSASAHPAAMGTAAPEPHFSFPMLAAIAALLAGTLGWAFGTLVSRKLELPKLQTVNSGLQMLIGGFFLFVLSGITGEWSRIPPDQVLFSLRIAGSMAYLVVAASLVTYTAYVWLIAHEPPSRVASYAYVNPVFALFLGATYAGEKLARPQIIGAALIIAGVMLTLRARQPTELKRKAQ